MKRLSCIFAITALMAVGCATPSNLAAAHEPSGPAQQKSAVESIFLSVWNQRRFENLDSIWDEDVKFHFRGTTEIISPEGLQTMVSSWTAVFPDLAFTVRHLVAEDNFVAAHVTWTATQLGDLGAIKATEKSVLVTQMMLFRFERGKIVEVWEHYDEYAMRQQLSDD